MRRCHPFSVKVHFLSIQVPGPACRVGEVKEERANTECFRRGRLQAQVMHGCIGIKRSRVVGSDLTLEPGAVATVETEEQRVKAFIKA